MSKKYSIPTRFYSLDVLRGIAALSVVLYHWRHSYNLCSSRPGFEPEQQPLYSIFYFFYEVGDRAVELFFTLSGFIFFWLYSDKIRARTIALRDFSILRLSRLYPLHAATLLTVLLLQTLYRSDFGCYFVYRNNDLYHFVLQLFFASNWGFHEGFSFNGPVWSVSVEVMLYMVFFGICWLQRDRTGILLLVALISYAVFYYQGYQVARGMFSFFIGGVLYKIFRLYFREIMHSPWRALIGVSAGLAWFVTLLEFHTPVFKTLFLTVLAHFSLASRYAFLYDRGVHFFMVAVLFPLTILALVVWEIRRGHLGKRVSFMGDLSYSSYLLHFPLQLVAVLVVQTLGYSNTVFNTPWSLLLFFTVLLSLSWLSYRYFEIPLQQQWRNKALKRPRVTA
ncbi:acyltransferase family protein [Larkinella insperata]|uniref:Acyltransferase family protein n=1 Tax=Larkinella insperata TaxID=332158 RepID=A0ABW3Q788_9BACT|nr:acyltransferase [Larkinella insperata]